MTPEKLLDFARELLCLQKNLLTNFFQNWKELKDMRYLLDFPKHGKLIVNDADEWTFKKHGVGLEFRRTKDGTLVNVEEFINEADLFTPWRLWGYIDSRKKKLVSGEREVESLMRILSAQGKVKKTAGGYQLIY